MNRHFIHVGLLTETEVSLSPNLPELHEIHGAALMNWMISQVIDCLNHSALQLASENPMRICLASIMEVSSIGADRFRGINQLPILLYCFWIYT